MESSSGKESVVSRLFGFGRKKAAHENRDEAAAPPPSEAETGFARTDREEPEPDADAEDEPRVTIPEQVIRIRTAPARRRDEVITVISDSFKELTGMLGSVSERLDRQDLRASDLADSLSELPDYLRALPKLQEEHNAALRGLGERMADGTRAMADALQRLPEAQEAQARSIQSISERVAEGTEAVHGVTDALARIPEEIRERSNAQEEAIRKVAASQMQMAKVVYAGQQKSMQLFAQATQKALQNVQRQSKLHQETLRIQQEQMEDLLAASTAGMKRMFVLAAAFVGAAVVAVAGLLLLG